MVHMARWDSREATLQAGILTILLLTTAAADTGDWLDIIIQDACFVGYSFPSLREQHGDPQVFTGETSGDRIRMALCMAKLYYYYDTETGLMEANENYIRHNGTFIGQNETDPECSGGLGFDGPRQTKVVIRNREMRVDEYTYCCKSIITTLKYKKPTVCNTPHEIRIAIRNANAQARK